MLLPDQGSRLELEPIIDGRNARQSWNSKRRGLRSLRGIWVQVVVSLRLRTTDRDL